MISGRSVVRPVQLNRAFSLCKRQQTAHPDTSPTRSRLGANVTQKLKSKTSLPKPNHSWESSAKNKDCCLARSQSKGVKKVVFKGNQELCWLSGEEAEKFWLDREAPCLRPRPGSSKAWERKRSLRPQSVEADRRHSVSSVGRVCWRVNLLFRVALEGCGQCSGFWLCRKSIP